MIKEDEIVEVSEITEDILRHLGFSGLTIRETLEALQNCKALILKQMSIDKNLDSPFIETKSNKCEECKELNKAIEIMNVFRWRGVGNYLSALAYDRKNETILVDEESLIRVIQLANPCQEYRKVRLITREEHKILKGSHMLDATSIEPKELEK
ncbi:hypothetical protein [Clostridium ihumii]|uniref:hypothetical protein n=1 Tax=Clostridium ihumii TaxID=1470356 RepID=UPI00054E0300|nr:hypothetical protein [Clostridium ihumii]